MADIDVDAFLAPVNDTAPCGEDLEYDAAYLALEEAARGKAEQQFGDTVIAAEEPDWRAMREQAVALFQRTRDLRVAIHLLRANTRLNGFAGFASGIKVLRGLVEQHWDAVYPQLDASDNNDPTMRLNALGPLADPTGLLADPGNVLADLRQAMVGSARDGLTVRQFELGLGKAEPNSNESAPSAAGVADALREASEQFPGLLDQMVGVVTASTLISYVFYTISPETQAKFGTAWLGLTIPFPLYGIFRYLYLVHQREGGGSPADLLLTDRPLLACVALWALTVAVIIYHPV